MTEHTSKKRFWDAVSSLKEGAQLKNVKFFLGANRNITQAELCEQAANALRHVQLGRVKPIASIDADIDVTPVKSFV